MKVLIASLITAAISFPLAAQPRNDAKTKGSPDRPADPSITLPADHADRSALLTGKVKAALADDVGLRTLRINVDSGAGGVVTLKGVVDSDDTKRRAEQVASAVQGVSSVDNQLSVRQK